jgi:hypothetical protein
MPFKSRRKNRSKKRKIRRKEKIQSGIACGLMITKKKHKRNSFWRCTKQNPKKKKKLFFQHKTPLAEIYIYISLTSRNLWKKRSPFQPPPMHFPKITFTFCPTFLPKPRKQKRSSHTSAPF